MTTEARRHGLGSAVHSWEYFVAECERGYRYTIYDFDNEIGCRDTIETMLYGSGQSDDIEYEHFRRRVRAADEKFRRLALKDEFRQSDHAPWWHRVIVKRAGEELASDLHSEYDVSVPVVSGRPKLP